MNKNLRHTFTQKGFFYKLKKNKLYIHYKTHQVLIKEWRLSLVLLEKLQYSTLWLRHWFLQSTKTDSLANLTPTSYLPSNAPKVSDFNERQVKFQWEIKHSVHHHSTLISWQYKNDLHSIIGQAWNVESSHALGQILTFQFP